MTTLLLTIGQKIRPKGDNVRSGWIDLKNSTLGRFGIDGFNWSSISGTYPLHFTSSNVYPSNGPSTRSQGLPVRCLVYKFKKRKTLYFVRSGNINVSRGEHSNIGGISYAMSNTTDTYANASTWGANAYFLRIDGWIVKPSSEDVRWLAFPVRCLVYWLHFRP